MKSEVKIRMTTGTPSFFNTHPRVCALVLAASNGSRLFPMTSSEMPKHLLPVAGIPCILRLLEHLSHVPQIVVALSSEDTVTVPLLQSALSCDVTSEQRDDKATIILLKSPSKIITVVKLSADCFGPVDALREIEESKIIHPSTRLVVFPGDLVFLDKDVNLDALLRPPQECDCTVLLVDVGEVDENGVPLKESAKVIIYPLFHNSQIQSHHWFLRHRPKKGHFPEMKRRLSILDFHTRYHPGHSMTPRQLHFLESS